MRDSPPATPPRGTSISRSNCRARGSSGDGSASSGRNTSGKEFGGRQRFGRLPRSSSGHRSRASRATASRRIPVEGTLLQFGVCLRLLRRGTPRGPVQGRQSRLVPVCVQSPRGPFSAPAPIRISGLRPCEPRGRGPAIRPAAAPGLPVQPVSSTGASRGGRCSTGRNPVRSPRREMPCTATTGSTPAKGRRSERATWPRSDRWDVARVRTFEWSCCLSCWSFR